MIVASIAFWALGTLWYSPFLFGKRWKKELGFTDEEMKKVNLPLTFGLSFVIMFLMVLGLSFFLSLYVNEDISWRSGMCLGFTTGLLFCMGTLGINYLYQRKSIVLWLIDGCYLFVGMGIAGIILGIWE